MDPPTQPEEVPPTGLAFRDEHGQLIAITRERAGALEVCILALGAVRLVQGSDLRVEFLAHVRDEDVLRSAYYRFALPLLLQAVGANVLHASAVETSTGVVAFCGPSGTGKSTTASQLDHQGFGGWADDLVVVDTGPKPVETIRLPFSFRLRSENGRDIRPPDAATCRQGDRRPLRAVVGLHRVSAARGRPLLTQLSRKDAFKLLLHQAHCFSLADVDTKRESVGRLFDLAEETPTFQLEFDPKTHGLAGVRAALTDWL